MRNNNSGLSLMEVMVTLVIVAVIAGLAYPRYQKMVLRSKQTEAKTVLRSIHMGQDLYLTANQTFAQNLDDLDIQIPADTEYTYSVIVGAGGSTFTATAQANIDNDPAMDEWQIDQENNLVNTINDVIEE